MKHLRQLESGALFQWANPGRVDPSRVYIALRPDEGVYCEVGRNVKGESLPHCSFPGCPVHAQFREMGKVEKHLDRAVRLVRVSEDSPLYQWVAKVGNFVPSTHEWKH